MYRPTAEDLGVARIESRRKERFSYWLAPWVAAAQAVIAVRPPEEWTACGGCRGTGRSRSLKKECDWCKGSGFELALDKGLTPTGPGPDAEDEGE